MFAYFKPSAWLGQSGADASQSDEDSTSDLEEDTSVEENAVQQKILDERKVLKERNRALRTRLHDLEQILVERPPIWVPDSERAACVGCGDAFSLFNRRHHCRCCGEVFDGKCASKYRELVFYPSSGVQRVCDVCYERPKAPRYADADLECSALMALGYGTENALDQSIALTEPLPARRKSERKVKRSSRRGEAESSDIKAGKRNAQGKLRSAIPPPPPFPSVLPGAALSAPGGRPTLNTDALAKKTKAFVPPKTNLKRLDQVELQQGISKLRKTPRTPKPEGRADENVPDFRSSLKRRRKALEDSILSSSGAHEPLLVVVDQNADTSNFVAVATSSAIKCVEAPSATPQLKAGALMDGLRERVFYKESPIAAVVQGTLNSSWLE